LRANAAQLLKKWRHGYVTTECQQLDTETNINNPSSNNLQDNTGIIVNVDADNNGNVDRISDSSPRLN
ncbi:unnamed protein product, partial [Rotaria sordida]